MAAARFGFQTVIYEPAANCPASQTANTHIEAAYDDHTALARLVAIADLVTYEFENIPLETVNYLEENSVLFPSSLALAKSQDRLVEKQFLNDIGIATAPYHPVDKPQDIRTGLNRFGTDAILKTRRFGYDGKGQIRVKNGTDDTTLHAIFDDIGKTSSILEGFVAFSKEISVIVARGRGSEIICYDPAENVHKDGILHTSTLPANIDTQTALKAVGIATKIVEALGYVGVMGVEFFVGSKGELMVNEIAPRVHNSGHWTEAACTISQFEQHIRAISGWALGSTLRHSNCVMENLIGNDIDRVDALASQADVYLHLYGKAEARPGRKMGHFTKITANEAIIGSIG